MRQRPSSTPSQTSSQESKAKGEEGGEGRNEEDSKKIRKRLVCLRCSLGCLLGCSLGCTLFSRSRFFPMVCVCFPYFAVFFFFARGLSLFFGLQSVAFRAFLLSCFMLFIVFVSPHSLPCLSARSLHCTFRPFSSRFSSFTFFFLAALASLLANWLASWQFLYLPRQNRCAPWLASGAPGEKRTRNENRHTGIAARNEGGGGWGGEKEKTRVAS